ncbi:MAG: hypothetical protein HYU29_03630 [Chloroflexi bacterium]|nr:hypothetical protein [Chloroflexota bacterium]
MPNKSPDMPPSSLVNAALEFHPVTPDRWTDLEQLFGDRGAFAGCWCMWWRLTRSQFQKQAGQGNKEAIMRHPL